MSSNNYNRIFTKLLLKYIKYNHYARLDKKIIFDVDYNCGEWMSRVKASESKGLLTQINSDGKTAIFKLTDVGLAIYSFQMGEF